MGKSPRHQASGCFIYVISLWGYMAISWIVNLIKLVNCNFAGTDFGGIQKQEIIHLVGLIPPINCVTCWL